MIVFVDENPEEIAALRDTFLRLRVPSACVTPHDVAHIARYPAQTIVIARPARIANLELIISEIYEQFPDLPLAIFYNRDEGQYYRYLSLCTVGFPLFKDQNHGQERNHAQSKPRTVERQRSDVVNSVHLRHKGKAPNHCGQ